jgi:purine-nucleoside phosphorylase
MAEHVMPTHAQVVKAAAYVQAKLGPVHPNLGIVLGSGLGAAASALTDPIAIPYARIPHFPPATVDGHAGQLLFGSLAGVPTVVLQGRIHFYEASSPEQVVFPVRVLGALGVRTLILTNAAGAINPDHHVGQLIALADHINLMGWNPLTGPNEPRFGPRFLDMTEAYSPRLRTLAASAEGFALQEGTYIAVSGPNFETPAEIRAFRSMGATLVGMSTVPETIVARHMGIEVLGLSCVTNAAAGLGSMPLSHDEVHAVGSQVEHRLSALLQRMAPRIAALYAHSPDSAS